MQREKGPRRRLEKRVSGRLVPDEAFQAEYLPVGSVVLEPGRVLLVVARLAIPFHIERVHCAPFAGRVKVTSNCPRNVRAL